MRFCGHQGFAGPRACILAKGHNGPHSYGHLAAAIVKDRERDADRYRWLRDMAYHHTGDVDGIMPWCVRGIDALQATPIEGDELDAAIDSAMLKTPNAFESLQKQNAKNEDDATRFAYLFSGKKTGSGALVELEMRMLNGDVPSLDEVRAAVDKCMKTPNAGVGGDALKSNAFYEDGGIGHDLAI